MLLEIFRSLVNAFSGGSAFGGSIVRCVLEDTIIGHSGLKVLIFGVGFLSGGITVLLLVLVYGQRRSPSTTARLSFAPKEHETRQGSRSPLSGRRVASEVVVEEDFRADSARADRRSAQGSTLNIHLVGSHPYRRRVPRGVRDG
eukprot:4247426-Amphidinium_carterae.1